MVRQLALDAWAVHQAGRIHLEYPFAAEVAEEGSERGHLAVNRAFLLVLFVERGHVFADCQVVNVRDIDLAAKAFSVRRRDVIVKLDEVAFVIAQSVIRCVALIFQMLDEIVNVFLHSHSFGFAFAEGRSVSTPLGFQLSSTNAFPLLRVATAFLHGRCDLGLPSPINGDCSVMVTSYYNPALTAFVDSHGERHFLSVAAFAAYLARVPWVDSFKRTASVLSFAFRHLEKASPGYIADCLGETAIPDHPANVQIFDRDRVKSSDQIGRHLVAEILATPRDFQVRFSDFDSLLRTPLRSLLFARKPPLLSFQIIHRFLEMAPVLDLFAVLARGAC